MADAVLQGSSQAAAAVLLSTPSCPVPESSRYTMGVVKEVDGRTGLENSETVVNIGPHGHAGHWTLLLVVKKTMRPARQPLPIWTYLNKPWEVTVRRRASAQGRAAPFEQQAPAAAYLVLPSPLHSSARSLNESRRMP